MNDLCFVFGASPVNTITLSSFTGLLSTKHNVLPCLSAITHTHIYTPKNTLNMMWSTQRRRRSHKSSHRTTWSIVCYITASHSFCPYCDVYTVCGVSLCHFATNTHQATKTPALRLVTAKCANIQSHIDGQQTATTLLPQNHTPGSSPRATTNLMD